MTIGHSKGSVSDEDGPILLPEEVARLFHVHVRTVARWAKQDRLPFFRTLGGHRRYREWQIREILSGGGGVPAARKD